MLLEGGSLAGDAFYPAGLDDPGCAGSIVSRKGAEGEDVVLLSNAVGPGRSNLRVKTSLDSGRTFDEGVLVWDGPAAYSMLVDGGDFVGVFFELGADSPYGRERERSERSERKEGATARRQSERAREASARWKRARDGSERAMEARPSLLHGSISEGATHNPSEPKEALPASSSCQPLPPRAHASATTASLSCDPLPPQNVNLSFAPAGTSRWALPWSRNPRESVCVLGGKSRTRETNEWMCLSTPKT
jgi:hypothetical protein